MRRRYRPGYSVVGCIVTGVQAASDARPFSGWRRQQPMLIINYQRNEEAAEELARRAREFGVRALPMRTDISDG